jgi:superfamily II DNA/RNA helicase
MDGSNVEIYDSFDTMGLKKSILKGVYSYGFERPSAIQQRAIVPFINGKDIIAQAQSGTGKTGTFSISVLQLIDENIAETQAIILSPTRELAKQTYTVVKALATYTKITTREVIGGFRFVNNGKGEREKEINEHIIVGTPGKVLDDLYHKRILTNNLRVFVLDEADEMLSKGFIEQVQNIFKYLTRDTRIGLFSATLSPEILKLTEEFMDDPCKILVKNQELTLEGLRQFYVDVGDERDKYDTLCDLYSSFSVNQSIIYCNSKKKVNWLTAKLQENNFTVACIYGDLNQNERNKIIECFRKGEIRIIITTNLLSRGIDFSQLNLILCYDLCTDEETYLHRIGRTGRYGKKGIAISFITKNDYEQMKRIEKYYNTKIEELPLNFKSLLDFN